MKKTLLIAMLLVMFAPVFAFVYEYEGKSLEYTIIDAEKKNVSVKAINDKLSGDVVIPSTVVDPNTGVSYTVTQIADTGFYKIEHLSGIQLPNTLEEIGLKAFAQCAELVGVITMPKSVHTIGCRAFYNCKHLEEIRFETLPLPRLDNIDELGKKRTGWFYAVHQVTIPNKTGVLHRYNTISDQQVSANFWKDIEVVDPTEIKVGDLYYRVDGENALLSGCAFLAPADLDIPSVVSAKGNTYNVTAVVDSAFLENDSITSLQLPESVIRVGNRAFMGSDNIATIYLNPTTPPLLGNAVFSSNPICYIPCRTLETYQASDWKNYVSTFEDPCNVDPTWQIIYTSTDGNVVMPYILDAFGANIIDNSYVDGQGVITCDGPVTECGAWAFQNCSTLQSIELPQTVTTIGDGAFQNCSALNSIALPDAITAINDWTFELCGALVTIDIPDNVTTIGMGAFHTCSSLTSITFSNQLVSIGNWAFQDCTALTSVHLPNTLTTLSLSAFCGCTLLDDVELSSSMTDVAEGTFYGCASLQSITLPNGIKTIGARAFSYTSLTSIVLPETVSALHEYAFDGCPLVSVVSYVATPPTLGINALTSLPICYIPCGTLTDYQASEWVGQVSEFIEEGCVVVQKCGDNLFWDYTDNVLTITGYGDMYDYAETEVPWYGVRENITQLIMPDEMTKIGNYAFYRCAALTSLTLPAQLKYIGNRAFAQDINITGEIIIPEGVTAIADRVFYGCNKVTRFTLLPLTPPTLGKMVFEKTSAPFYISCDALGLYSVATKWQDLASRFVDACLTIYHYTTHNPGDGVYATNEKLVANITYKRLFTPYKWETVYLPFEVDRVTVTEEGIEYDIYPWDITLGGEYYLAESAGCEGSILYFQTTSQSPEQGKPYIIQFPHDYYADKLITFHGSNSWNKLSSSFTPLSGASNMQFAGNTTLQTQTLSDNVYMLRATDDFILQNASTELHPFECYVMPQKVSGSALAPRLSIRIREKNDVTTLVSYTEVKNNLIYSKDGNILTLYTNGQEVKIYSLNGILLCTIEQGKETAQVLLEQGCYIIYSNGNSQKIIL